MPSLFRRSAYYASRSILRLSALIALSFTAARAHAQSSQIEGVVTDTQKAVISDAKVSITQVETGVTRTVQSGSDGHYAFPLLNPGHYNVRVEHDGFDAKLAQGVTVLTGSASVVDVSLNAGQVTQVVDVSADVPLVQTDSSSIHKVIENETIANMPLLDRRASQLQRLSGFVISSGSGSGATFAIAGGRGGNANYFIDGGTAQNLLQGVPTLSFDPPVEALQEFNLAISNYEAELGRTGGGVLQMTTRSGTNHFHGSVYEYFRNDAIQATQYFASTKPRLRYNLFGASFGGPIIKDRTHFFFTYEGRRATTTNVVQVAVPTAAMRQGDFSAFSAVVTNPYTGAQAVGDDGTRNKLPSSVIDPLGAKIAALYPDPNVAGAAAGSNNYRYNDPTAVVVNAYVARIDHVIGQNNRIFGHLLTQIDTSNTASIFPTPGTDSFGAHSDNYYYNESATWLHNFSPTVINELRATFTQRKALAYSAGAGTTTASQIGLQGTDASFFPQVTLSGLTAFGNSQHVRLQVPIISNDFSDQVTFSRGKHQFKGGFEWRTSANSDVYRPSAGGSFAFNNIGVSPNTSTYLGSLANLLMGRVSSATLQDTLRLNTTAYSYSGFFQDDWRLTSRLTLNLGIRYDIDSPRFEDLNRQNSFDPTAINPVSNTPGVITFSGRNGLNKYAHQWDNNNFGPRLGFAYKVDEKSVVRGGFALLYPGAYDQASPIVAYTGFAKKISLSSANPGAGTPAFLLKNNLTDGTGQAATPTEAQLNSSFGAVPVGQKVNQDVEYFNRDRKNGYLYQANLNIQREILPSLLIEAGYLGTFGHHLSATSNLQTNQVAPNNQALLATTANTQTLRPFPQFGSVAIIARDYGASTYHGLNIGLQKRASHGLQLGANYTFAKYIDNIDARSNVGQTGGTVTDYYHPETWRGLSGNDVRHRLIVNAIYDLPFGRGKLVSFNSPLLNQAVGGWTIGGIFETHTGTPLEIYDSSNNTGTFSAGVRPNLSGQPFDVTGSRSRSDKLNKWFNTAAFSANPNFTFGNAPRAMGTGPGTNLLDASVLKDFSVTEHATVQFRVEALNVLNHANFANPNTAFGAGSFGQITSLQAGDNRSRVLQFALHVAF